MSRATTKPRARARVEVRRSLTGKFIPKGAPCVILDDAIEHPFVVGDIVTRDGTDEQEVIGVNWAGDLIEVRCIKAPAAWEGGVTWCKVGDVESNLARRYELVRLAAKRLEVQQS